jgi:hypothetical protein
MNAFDKPTGPSLFSRTEIAQAQKPMRDHTPGQAYWASKAHPFCVQLPSQRAQDRSNAIKSSPSCHFSDCGDRDRKALKAVD